MVDDKLKQRFIDNKPKGVLKMIQYKLGEVEMRFANIIWDNEPIGSGELVKLAQEELSWKKPTTYSILRKLCEKGIFQNQNAMVTSIVTKKEYISMQSEKFVDETFSGSLPSFFASFISRKKMSNKDIMEIQKIIDDYKEV